MKNVYSDPETYEKQKKKAALIEALDEMIQLHPLFKEIKREALDRFWDMFIIDAYIGNPNRSSDNWGVVIDAEKNVRLAPVYGNSKSLNYNWRPDEMKLFEAMPHEKQLHIALESPCFHVDKSGNRIIPCTSINNNSLGTECEKAIIRNVPKIKKAEDAINELIENTPCLSECQQHFYKSILRLRLENALLPAYESLMIH